MMIVLLLWPQMGLFFIHVSGNVFVDDVAKELLPEVLVLHGPDRPLGLFWLKLKLESLVVADLLLVGCHVHS